MDQLGVLPAAGRGSRWGGVYKELLPTGAGRWLVDDALDRFREAGIRRVCVVTSLDKVAVHTQHFAKPAYHDLEMFYVVQRTPRDLWGAVCETLPYAEGLNYLVMPDTRFTGFLPIFARRVALAFGVFPTDQPERFGVVTDAGIRDKDPALAGVTHPAWGSILWTRDVAEAWREREFGSFQEALSWAMGQFTWGTFPITDYQDMASWEDYARHVLKEAV